MHTRMLRLVILAAAASVAAAALVSTTVPTAAPPERRITTLEDAQLAANAFTDGYARLLSVSGFTGGSSTLAAHPGLATIDNVRVVIAAPANSAPGAGGAGGRAVLEPVVITKDVDAYSPQFFRAAATGVHLATVTVFVTRTGVEAPYDIATYTFSDAVVTRDVVDGQGNEVVTLDAATQCVTYRVQAATGTLTPIRTCFDRSTGTVS